MRDHVCCAAHSAVAFPCCVLVYVRGRMYVSFVAYIPSSPPSYVALSQAMLLLPMTRTLGRGLHKHRKSSSGCKF